MNKGLEALKEIGNYSINDIDIEYCVKDTHDYKIVESELKRLNYIDENKIYCISENYLKDIKKLKAFEIVKKYFWLEDFQDFVAFNGMLPKSLKEEFDLLKEVLL